MHAKPGGAERGVSGPTCTAYWHSSDIVVLMQGDWRMHSMPQPCADVRAIDARSGPVCHAHSVTDHVQCLQCHAQAPKCGPPIMHVHHAHLQCPMAYHAQALKSAASIMNKFFTKITPSKPLDAGASGSAPNGSTPGSMQRGERPKGTFGGGCACHVVVRKCGRGCFVLQETFLVDSEV